MSHIIMIDEPNGNSLLKSKHNNLVPSFSSDDISQSQSASEYTDADESMSCPTEFLAEFLSAVMLKDYKKALKYCKLILEFEPNNGTAKEFYPLILEKMKYLSSNNSTENLNNSSALEFEEAEEDLEESDDSTNESGSDCDYSCASDEDKEPNDCEEDPNHSNTSSNCTSGSENTTHSYPSSLLEEEDYLHPLSNLEKLNLSPSLSDLNNGNYKTNSASESESPTEPLTQHIANTLSVKENDF